MNANAKETLVSGFTFWAWCRAKPRGATAQEFIRQVKSDSRFPKHLDSRDVLQAWVRYGPRMPAHVRRAERQVWQSYAQWRRAPRSEAGLARKRRPGPGRTMRWECRPSESARGHQAD